ncbi:BT_3928 family protein [Pedobacter cryoconitis]|uniref:Putative membrane protein YphA (DoxX/SURF4 family) n=1 Tax=Pedobacter cryoconitis TaxID=188932 RepID=A0A7X0J6M3_9SPHI|nr:BT_3928 family protein [Pedobacter cryoconitis]MBB6501292.1 putative membrane protein YphA (DoxX/SURF4 family) [Pedobacter cryoconitis]
MNRAVLNFSRIFVGVLFIFSGLIKANDPLGFGYKLEEYFDVFHISFLSPFATGIAIFLCVLEIVLGALLLFGFWSKKVTTGLLGIIIFFTFLTFVSAAFKVVTSCGCFGDAIPLTPWQSFSKDLILLVLIVYLFINRTKILPVTQNPGQQKAGLIGVLAISVLFSIYTYSYLPVLDFLPYKVGASIPDAMKIPEGAAPDVYQILYKLKNKATGETKEMSDKDYLKTEIWKDNNWEIVGQPEQKLIKKGYEAKIKDLVISDASGTNYTKELIENPYYNFLVVAYNLKDTNEDAIGKLNAMTLDLTEQFNIRTVLLTSNSAQDAGVFSKNHKLLAEIFYADAVPLKSMVRANPGILLMKNGVVVNKWSFRSLPSLEKLKAAYFNK